MKNLLTTIRKNIDLKSGVVAHCVDADNGLLFVLTKELKLIKATIYNEDVALQEQSLNDELIRLVEATSVNHHDVMLFELVVEVGGLLLALRSGHLLIISATSTDCHCIYKHKTFISSISLSPSQDLIALADEDNNIQVMCGLSLYDCEILHTSNAFSQNDSLHKPVGVGWGSKETQFFGLDGRPSQEKQQSVKIQLSADEIDKSDRIEGSVEFIDFQRGQTRSTVIDWRGDGQLIATLTFIPEANKHYIKVWNRNLELQYMSEQLVTVERGLLCWIPDGRYICCAQRRDRRLNELALFEKNGLVRQRISLPLTMADMYIHKMAWSPDSRILAMIIKQFHVNDDKIEHDNILMLYTMQNWHYYLKSSIKLGQNCDFSLRWDATTSNRLHIMSTSGLFIQYDCSFYVTYSDQYSTVSVVDGNRVLLTPLETCVIPPPMSAISLETENPIYKIAVDCEANIFILTLDGKFICTSKKDSSTHSNKSEHGSLKVTIDNQIASKLHTHLLEHRTFYLDEPFRYQHLVPLDSSTLMISRVTHTGSEIVKIKFPVTESEGLLFEEVKAFEKRQVICMSSFTSKDIKCLSVVLNDSTILLVDLDNVIEQTFELHTGMADLKFSYNVIASATVNHLSTNAVISLGQDYCLRYNKDVLASNCCTSFRITKNYLIYTTSENSMHFILLRNLFENKVDLNLDSWSQPIENGSSIIIASEPTSKVVLQMPRGNLETVHPRVLLFSKLTHLLDQEKYIEACKLARRHRVNMNFLIDYLARIEKDCDQIWRDFAFIVANQDPNLLCLIITELDNTDTISGRYQNIVKHIPPRKAEVRLKFELSEKVIRFCSCIALPVENKFLYPRIQRLLKPMEQELRREAVELVHTLEQDLRLNAIKYILYFVDIDQLFKDALSTYDTDIALMVASASNKDPKQYLALLDDFNSIKEPLHRRFKIDTHIKRYDKAIEHFCSLLLEKNIDSDEFTEENLVELVVSKRLYRHAIFHLQSRRFRYETYEFEIDSESQPNNLDNLLCRIWIKYADYLLEKRHYDEAGLAYSKALRTSCSPEHFSSALKCYSFLEDWEKSIALIVRSKIEFDIKVSATTKLVKQLMERGKFQVAMMIEQLLANRFGTKFDIEYCRSLMESEDWYLVEIFSGTNFPKVAQYMNLLGQANSLVDNWLAQLTMARERFDRLKEVFTTQQNKQNSITEKNFISDSLSTVDGSELSSIAGLDTMLQGAKVARSGATSIKTRSSSKSNKPINKRINLKAGSRHEDIALILELKKFIAEQKQNREQCIRYSSALFQYLVDAGRADIEVKRLNDVVIRSLGFAQEVSELLWPTGPHMEQKYSLYKRFNNVMNSESPENVDFEIMIRPDLPKTIVLFDL